MQESKDFEKILIKTFDEGGVPILPGQAQKMAAYFECLLEENRKYNLTAITQPEEAAAKHFLDSALGAALLPPGAAVADVGSGAGFPAAPLAVMREDCSVTALEATEKKCRFIETACAKAGVGIRTLNLRAEGAGRGEWREAFDVCASRAVAELPILLELCAPLVRPGGLVLAYKNANTEELESAKNAMDLLSLRLAQTVRPEAFGGARAVLVFEKTKATDGRFPRKFAQIKKKPL